MVHGSFGRHEIPDHVAALRQLAAERPWMDLDRVGIHGKSWGGYYAVRAMLTAPEIYKVGVAAGVATNLRHSISSAIVPYMGLPADNPEGYEHADCLPLADRLQGKLLLTAGTADRNTHFGHAMRLLQAFNEADKDVEILVLPDTDHWPRGAAFRRWQRALKDFFLEHLPPDA